MSAHLEFGTTFTDDIRETLKFENGISSRMMPLEIMFAAEIPQPGIIISHLPESITPVQVNLLVERVGPASGSEIITYPNLLFKSVHRALSIHPHTRDSVPDYTYSCPKMDSQLFGKYPKTNYLDIGRGGVWFTTRRSMDYLIHTQEKITRSKNFPVNDWIARYGIGGCIPVTTRASVVDWAAQNSANAYLVPGTSIAEGVISAVKRFPAMHDSMRILFGDDSWLNKKSSYRDKGSDRLYELLANYMLANGMQKTLYDFHQAKSRDVRDLTAIFMKIADNVLKLGKSPTAVNYEWTQRIYNPRSPHNHPVNGFQADASEIVVKADRNLTPVPWELFILFGDTYGTTRDQLTNQALLIRQLYPEANVVILTDRSGEPLKYDPETPDNNRQMAALVSYWSHEFLWKKVWKDFKRDILPYIEDNPLFSKTKKYLNGNGC